MNSDENVLPAIEFREANKLTSKRVQLGCMTFPILFVRRTCFHRPWRPGNVLNRAPSRRIRFGCKSCRQKVRLGSRTLQTLFGPVAD